MRALITLNSVFPIHVGGATSGGIEVYAINVAEALAKKSWVVDIVCSKDSTTQVENVNIIKLGVDATKTREARGEHNVRFNWKDYMNVIENLDITSYDLIIVNNHYLPLVQYLNDHASGKCIIHYNQILPIWKDCLPLVPKINDMKNVHQCAISDLICNSWNKLGCNYHYLPYGFIDKFNGDLNGEINYGIFTMSCRIIPEKNPLKLHEVINGFKKKYGNTNASIRGRIIGVGDINNKYYQSVVKASDEGGDDFYIDKEHSGDNYKWIQYLDEIRPIVISLARIEALGITPIEAMMCGLPCYTIKNEKSAVSETLFRDMTNIIGKDNYKLTMLGGVADNMSGLIDMIYDCIDLKPFDRYNIRNYFLTHYSMENHINNLLKLL